MVLKRSFCLQGSPHLIHYTTNWLLYWAHSKRSYTRQSRTFWIYSKWRRMAACFYWLLFMQLSNSHKFLSIFRFKLKVCMDFNTAQTHPFWVILYHCSNFRISCNMFMGVHSRSWIFMGVHSRSWMFMEVHSRSWMLMGVHSRSWIFMGVHNRS